jgi:hypothetical protein
MKVTRKITLPVNISIFIDVTCPVLIAAETNNSFHFGKSAAICSGVVSSMM